jgi:hypothetical protein
MTSCPSSTRRQAKHLAKSPAIAAETLMTQQKQMLGKLLSLSKAFECENIKKKRPSNIP